MDTALVVLAILLHCSGDAALEGSEGLFSDFFFGEVVGDDIFDEFADVLISFGEIFGEFVGDHVPELFSLLDGLCLFDGGM